MKDKDVHKHIEEIDKENKEIRFQRICESLTFSKNTASSKNANSNKHNKKILICSILAVCSCLVIVSTILVIIGNFSNKIRYYSSNDCVYQMSEYTLKDYTQKMNKSLLYFDWYDTADEIITNVYKDKDNRYVYIEEIITDFTKELIATVYITDNKTEVDFLKAKSDECELNANINNIQIRYHKIFPSQIFAFFQYKDNNYFISLQSTSQGGFDDVETVIEIIQEMF